MRRLKPRGVIVAAPAPHHPVSPNVCSDLDVPGEGALTQNPAQCFLVPKAPVANPRISGTLVFLVAPGCWADQGVRERILETQIQGRLPKGRIQVPVPMAKLELAGDGTDGCFSD